jgi:mono/diheme cytochrome c family protein
MKKALYLLIALIGFISVSVQAEGNSSNHAVVKELLAKYALDARKEALDAGEANPKPVTFSVDAGRAFYLKRRTWEKGEVSCSSCHTADPTKDGAHVQTKKPINPLALSKNPSRFNNAKKVEQNFSKHCVDLYQRDCTAQNKGDFLTYLIWVK